MAAHHHTQAPGAATCLRRRRAGSSSRSSSRFSWSEVSPDFASASELRAPLWQCGSNATQYEGNERSAGCAARWAPRFLYWAGGKVAVVSAVAVAVGARRALRVRRMPRRRDWARGDDGG